MRDHAQFPLNAIGPSGQHAFLGVQRVYFTGATGLIGTMYGVPGVRGATRVATGIYRFSHDPCVNLDIIPAIEAPSGAFYDVNIPVEKKGTGGSGAFDVHMYVHKNYGFGTGVASGALELQNPATGTALKLMIYGSPINGF